MNKGHSALLLHHVLSKLGSTRNKRPKVKSAIGTPPTEGDQEGLKQPAEP